MMRRSVLWAVIALLPLAGALLMMAVPDDPNGTPILLPQTPFIVEHWFLVLASALLAQMLFFAVHAWRNPKVGPNRRMFWVVAIILFAFVATPLYWWHYSESAT